MKRNLRSGLLLLLVFCSAVVFAQQGWLDRLFPKKSPQVLSNASPSKPLVEPHPDALALQDSFAKVAEAVKPAVVNISAVQIAKVPQDDLHQFFFGDPNDMFRQFFGEAPRRAQPREYRAEGTGSGVIIDPDGYILTNNHVVQEATQLTVTMSDEKTYKAKLIGTDPRTDLAILQIKGNNPFAYVPLGDSAQARIGDWVLAIGSPFGLEQTVTAGIISAIRQSLNIEGKSFRNLLQTDAAINRGNSGGPLVNIRGEVVGINTAIYAPTGVFSGVGFAIPVNDAKKILRQLIEKGYVERSWLGVEIAEVDEVIAQQFGLKAKEGALINRIMPNSPADKAGLRRGDVVIEFDGRKITTVQTLQDFVSNTPSGKRVKIKYIRAGKTESGEVKTELMPSQNTAQALDRDDTGKNKPALTVQWLGCTFADLLSGDHEGGTPMPSSGALVIEVPAQSAGAEAGLMEGDVIQGVNQTEIKNTSDLKKVMDKADLKKGIVFDVVREGRSFYLSYKSL